MHAKPRPPFRGLGRGLILLTVRINPNAFDGAKIVSLGKRIDAVAAFCSSFLTSRPGPDEYDPRYSHIKIFFFHSKEGAHHLSALKEAHEDAGRSIFFHGNVVDA